MIKSLLNSKWIVVIGGIAIIFCLYMALNYSRAWVLGLPVIGAMFIIAGFAKEE